MRAGEKKEKKFIFIVLKIFRGVGRWLCAATWLSQRDLRGSLGRDGSPGAAAPRGEDGTCSIPWVRSNVPGEN